MVAEGDPDRYQSQRQTAGVSSSDKELKLPSGDRREYTDDRKPWEWQSRYPPEAQRRMNTEAYTLIAMLVLSLIGTGVFLGLADEPCYLEVRTFKVWVNFRILAVFCTGCVGGVTFSIKWLIHAAAKGKWHTDRRYWRLMVPAIGGVYACVVMTLFASGMFSGQASQVGPLAATAALAFLVGYFSDGVSGLLSNVANAVFGTLEKK